jgi:hypothetical protein
MYFDFTAGDNSYKLRLTTRGLVTLEKDLGYNPIQLFGVGNKPKTPSTEDMLKVFKASLQPYHSELTEDEAYKIFDTWIDEGHLITEFIATIVEIYKVSGLIKSNNAKN